LPFFPFVENAMDVPLSFHATSSLSCNMRKEYYMNFGIIAATITAVSTMLIGACPNELSKIYHL
jgi:hypothetical protein